MQVVSLLAVFLATAAHGTSAAVSPPERDSGTLVVGGVEAPVGKYTFATGIRQTDAGRDFCGGTLIAPQYVLTAAHCISANPKWVSVGTHFNAGTSDGEQIEVEKATRHPKYEQEEGFDLAVLKLKTPVNSSITPALLASNSSSLWNQGEGQENPLKLRLLGWGRVDPSNDEVSPVLKELDVPVVDSEKCHEILYPVTNIPITPSMICAGGVEGESSCHGDSGGPLVYDAGNDSYVLVGAVSWGVPCATGRPDVYARISYLTDFIDEHSEGHAYAQ